MKLRTLIAATLSLAAVFAIPANAGWVGGFEGYSVFGDTDAAGGPVCPLCDSTVNFAVWEREDPSWLTDDPFNTRNVEGLASDPGDYLPADAPNIEFDIDTAAQYVLLYQVINTNPLDVGNPELENFNVTKTLPNGDPIAHQPYSSGGYIEDTVFVNASTAIAPLDVPNNWEPSNLEDTMVPLEEVAGAQDPDALLLTDQLIIASPSVRNGAEAYSGALFEFAPLGTGTIQPGGTSSLLFLTFSPGVSAKDPNFIRQLGYVWAETQSPGGFGAAGDVPGVKNVPEPATLALLSLGLVGLGVTRRRRKTA